MDENPCYNINESDTMNKDELFINHLPLKTERLVIRHTILDDVDLLLKMDKQEETQLYLGGLKDESKEERIAFLDKKINNLESSMVSLTILKEKVPIGFIDLNIDEKENTAEISYIFDYDHCNNGYCTEACQKILDVCFSELNIESISASVVSANNSSKRVLERLGFSYERETIKDSIEFSIYIKHGG